jgi:transglutaminase-like putative cysteine protease
VKFSIRYQTDYRYDGEVADNLNALRVTPATTSCQRLDDFGVRVSPEARLDQHVDYFGTNVIEFGVARPHDHLSIEVRAHVATSEPPEPPECTWAQLDEPAYTEAVGEFLLPFGDDVDDITLDELVGLMRAETPTASLHRIAEVVPDRFEYRTGVTYVGSTVQDLLDAGGGVCQDFAHLSLLLLRRNGIAARYVSGYLFAPPGGDETADSAEVDTHAWVEAALPAADEPGEVEWVAVDPTNRCLGSARHVKIGHGRAYADVPPIKGVFRGGASSRLEASVRMHRTDRMERVA